MSLDRTAKVSGDIIHQILAIEPVASFEGHVRHSDPAGAGDSRRGDSKNGAGNWVQSSASADQRPPSVGHLL